MSPALDYIDNEVSLTVTNTNQAPMTLEAGTRFAQMVLDKTYRANMNTYISLPSIDQQTNGESGSTGGDALSSEREVDEVDCDCLGRCGNKLM